MVVLGLGSNLGDRVGYLTDAFRKLIDLRILENSIRVSSTYQSKALLPDGAPSEWNQDFLNLVIVGKTSKTLQQVFQEIKKIEMDLGRKRGPRWSPREIDIDLLYFDEQVVNDENLKVPHPEIFKRDFVWQPLAELFPDDERFRNQPTASACEKLSLQILPCELVGILNSTPDSFSDGGLYSQEEAAIQQIQRMIEAGASIIDLGAESTRPGANPLSSEEEWSRLSSIVRWIEKNLPSSIKWSIDTRHPKTAEKCLEHGVHFVNDVSGLDSSEMRRLVKESGASSVIMHHLGIPADRSRILDLKQNPVEAVLQSLEIKKKLCLDEGIEASQLIFDPGIGFGKNAQQSLELIQACCLFEDHLEKIYYGHSRKSFLNLISKKAFSERDLETAVVSSFLMKEGARYLRVHDIKSSREAICSQLLISSY